MKIFDRRFLGASTLLVGGTGVAYGVVRYLLKADDPFSVVNHPRSRTSNTCTCSWLRCSSSPSG